MITKLAEGFTASCDSCRRDYKETYPAKESEFHDELRLNGWAVAWTKGHKKVYCPRCLQRYDPKWRDGYGGKVSPSA